MKIKNRVLCVLVAVILCIGVIPVMASAAGDDISQAFYFAETDKLQWSLVEGAAYYGLVLYESSDESDGTEVARLEPTTNYLEASEVIPYSGDFYFSVMALNASGWPMGMGKTSAVFSYTVSEIDTPTCTCTTRCYVDTIEESGCDVCGSSGNPSDCMGTPELVQNGGVYRLSDSTAEIGFMGSTNASVTWTYHYQVTATADEQPTAAEIISAGESGAYSDPMLLTVTDLSAGEKTIHMVLHQKEQERTTNVLRLTIPAYVPLTITPSAQGGNYDAKTNTLTIFGGTTVTFTTNEAGCGMGYKEGTTQGPELIFSGEEEYTRTAVFPSTLATYVVVAGIGGREAECTIVVKAAPSLPINGVSGGWSFIETTLLEFVRNMTTPLAFP